MQFGIREAVFLLLLLAVPVATYFMVLKPAQEAEEEARAEMSRKLAKLAELETAIESYDDLGAEIEKLKRAMDGFEEKLPADHEVDVIVRQIWELATRYELTTKSIRPDKLSVAANYSDLPIKIELAGDFDGFYQFLQAVERLPRITRVSNMELERLKDGEVQMEASLVMSIFFEPPGGLNDRVPEGGPA